MPKLDYAVEAHPATGRPGRLAGRCCAGGRGRPDEELVVLATEANVDPVELEGAVVTVGEPDPRRYLVRAVISRHRVPTIASVLTRLAACESTSRWHVNTGNSYFGGLQMSMTFWRRHGGLAFAPRPDLASREQQIGCHSRAGSAGLDCHGRRAAEDSGSGRCGSTTHFRSDDVEGHQSTSC